MKRDEYLRQPEVKEFIKWLSARFEEPNSFCHSWNSMKPRTSFASSSLWDAHAKYEWKGSFAETEQKLAHWSEELQGAADANDTPSVLQTISTVGRWGGIGGTTPESIDAFVRGLPRARQILNPAHGDTSRVDDVAMSALFSKVYRLLISDFPIYDSRVAAALGYCVRLFLEDSSRGNVPPTLAFGWAPGRDRKDGSSPLRNPSTAGLAFPRMSGKGVHARSNLMAAWLFRELADLPCFGVLDETWRTDAVQSAFFMVGYDLTPAK